MFEILGMTPTRMALICYTALPVFFQLPKIGNPLILKAFRSYPYSLLSLFQAHPASSDKQFARRVEYGPLWHKLDKEEKDKMIYGLDALMAHLYSFPEKQLTHIFETSHRKWDCKPRLTAVLKAFYSRLCQK